MHKEVRLCLRRLGTELTVAKAKFLHQGHSPHRVDPKYSQRGACELRIVVHCRFPGERYTISSKLLILTPPSL